ncbi:MAG TPA: hypothetical protein DEB17_01615 [Chlorobaculum sp.]|uniref:Uncharacterized protein n=1 Tax=Chlorobaculum tepidum (strain ATCC 49652 / DSM 12025 / NBRC 103806 / TLS) TaxID=194439 RepID=Q8KDD8_CHLTE|nr:hypothetical protein CT1116 [Chlorobaculum tepidum TLS]HBU22696.1 hypothetical protein [Chlorobaculum sp.]
MSQGDLLFITLAVKNFLAHFDRCSREYFGLVQRCKR